MNVEKWSAIQHSSIGDAKNVRIISVQFAGNITCVPLITTLNMDVPGLTQNVATDAKKGASKGLQAGSVVLPTKDVKGSLYAMNAYQRNW